MGTSESLMLYPYQRCVQNEGSMECTKSTAIDHRMIPSAQAHGPLHDRKPALDDQMLLHTPFLHPYIRQEAPQVSFVFVH